MKTEVQAHRKIPQVPFFRSIWRLLEIAVNPIPVLNKGIVKYGHTYRVRVGEQKAIVTSDPAILGHVLQKSHRNYQKSSFQRDSLGRFLGQGLLTSEGEYWLRQRRLIQPGFHKEKLSGLMSIMQDEVRDFTKVLDAHAQSGKAFDFSESMMELTLKVVMKSLFGTGLDQDELKRVGNLITGIQEYIVKRIRQPYLIPWFYLGGAHRKAKKMSEEGDEIIYKVIKARKASGETHHDLLDMLLESRYEDTGEGMTDQQLRDESLILFVAGHETSANALTWIFYLLGKHPEVVAKLRAEFDSVLGEKSPGFDDLPKLDYTRQVIQEGMRLYPPAWITDRQALDDDEVDGIQVKKGEVFLLYIYGIHHSPESWDRPEEFIPERFSAEQMKQQTKFAYSPFGAGPRLCIGNNFAMMEMQLILAEIIRRYDWQLVEGQEIDLEPLITLRARFGVHVSIKRR